MQIPQGTALRIPFLLIDEQMRGVENLVPAVRLALPGDGFQVFDGEIREIGDGWYDVEIGPDETVEPGAIILLASAEGAAHEWRDVIQVVPPAPEISAEDLQAAIQAELEQWAMTLTVPIKMIRAGSAT